MPTILQLQNALRLSWRADTAFNSQEWTSQNPARGQCVVSSLIVQQYFGGELQKVTTSVNDVPESHYFNVLPDRSTLDLTHSQYPADQQLHPVVIQLHGFASAREKLLSDFSTYHRYTLLLRRVQNALESTT